MAHLSISLLGALQISCDGEPVTDFATDKARALLAFLTVEADRPHRRDTLAGLLWPDQPQEKARQSLRQALSDARKAIGDCDDEPFLLVSRETIQFNTDCDHWLDVTAFGDLVKDCETHRHRRLGACLPCIRRLERMIDLYQGPFLEQFFLSDSNGFEEWAMLRREWLQREVTEALSHLADHCERRSDYKRAQQYVRRQVLLEPWREEAHRQLMRLLVLDGQRSAALAQYETCRRALATEMGVEPTAETQALYEQIREGEASVGVWGCGSALTHPHTPTLNLSPSPTPFVGREVELTEIAELLANPNCRLVTLFGPGGIGKTRLALQVAADHLGVFEDGVAFVPLAHVDALAHLAPAIAGALDLPFHSDQDPKEQLLNYLRQKELLLVLDNLEHILECTGFLSAMLRHAPGVVLLATSREKLNLHEEWVYEIEGLAYPRGEAVDVAGDYSALDLFRQRACQADRRFTLSKAERVHAVRICQLVGGMPLGIELAASWIPVHSCEEIAEQIASSLDILATRLRNVPERHRSMWATFEHSFQLLAEEERGAFAGLSVFRGGFSREAAAAVTGASLALLTALQDKSLIRRVSPDRYDMHQLLRQYTAEKLQSMPEICEAARIQHARYFTAFLGRQQPRLKTAEQRQALQEIETEIENARIAWDTAISRGWAEQVEQSLESFYQFYSVRGRCWEGIDLLRQAIERWRDDPQHKRVFGATLARQGALCIQLGYHDQAEAALEESLSIFERLEVVSEQIFCLLHLLHVMRHHGAYDQAEALALKSLDLSREIQDGWSIARSLDLIGLMRYRMGDIDQAEALCEESLAISRQIGHQQLMLWPLNRLADIACHRGDFVRAQSLFNECIALARALGDLYNEAIHLNNQGTVLHVLENYEEAEKLFLSSLEICRKISDRIGEAIALSNLGKVAHDLGDYEQALAYYQEGLAIGREIGDRWTLMSCLSNLGWTACVLNDDEVARAYLAEALEIACEAQTSPVQTEILTYLGVFFAKRDQRDRAAELLTLTSQHPASELDVKNRAQRLLTDLNLAPPEGAPRPLEVVAAEVLAELAR
ncbi:MAG: tetratricopeptide repeat protein [Anaerolineae bacterium]|nr:tetratricopeptide repeat protein [Anaerolineae bacterium]